MVVLVVFQRVFFAGLMLFFWKWCGVLLNGGLVVLGVLVVFSWLYSALL